MKYQKEISKLYDSNPANEWERLDRHRTEFAVTSKLMAAHLPPPPAKILDCGGGPGRYALELSQRGYEVTLFDLSAGNLALARQKAQEIGAPLENFEQGSALDLGRFPDETFDIVLVMGPLYHLLEASDRKQALREVYRVMKPGGQLWAAFITRFAPLKWCAANDPNWVVENPTAAHQIWETGQKPPAGTTEPEFVAYFAHPDEVQPLISAQGFFVQEIFGVEGFVSETEEKINDLTGKAWETWVDLNTKVASNHHVHGAAEHLLVLAEKPCWRAALSFVANRLNQEGIDYRVVGGTAIALHGIPIEVCDIDIELSTANAYRCQEIFSEYVTNPVTYSSSEIYRSHFGQLEIEGQDIDIMGDLERCENGNWVPTTNLTREIIDLDGVPVMVPWLEENVLANLRRGKLNRASLGLRHCDQDRIRHLLIGDIKTNVI